MMDFRKIEYFLKVAETMNISRAAEQLNISRQGLSKQIGQLENEIGAALLERNVTGIVLTETGRKLNEWFRPAVNEVNYRYQKLLEFVELKKTTFVIGYFNALSFRKCIRPILEKMESLEQSLKIDVLATDVGQVRKMLLEDITDLAVTTMMDPDDWKEFTYFELDRFPLQIIVSERHPWYQKESISDEDLGKGSLLVYADGSSSISSGIKVKEHVPAYNFDSYITRLEQGKEFGLIADIYSRREGEFRLMDLPENSRKTASLIAAYRNEHPLRRQLEMVFKKRSEPGKE